MKHKKNIFSFIATLIFFLPIQAAIYDCFIFYNELDLLEIRFEELYNDVDYFVLVEAAETFRGVPKPFYFEENKERFAKFLDKVIHVKLIDLISTQNPWDREIAHRNAVVNGLTNAKNEDIVMLSDVDEIPASSKLSEMVQFLSHNPHLPVCFVQDMYLYFLNLRMQTFSTWGNIYDQGRYHYSHKKKFVVHPPLDSKDKKWLGTIALSAKAFKKATADRHRAARRRSRCFYFILNGGWHFTTLGCSEDIVKKYKAWSHHEYDNSDLIDQESILSHINEAKVAEINDSFPNFIINNWEALKSKGLIL